MKNEKAINQGTLVNLFSFFLFFFIFIIIVVVVKAQSKVAQTVPGNMHTCIRSIKAVLGSSSSSAFDL